ncbi:MAG: ORF6N domain-containing protein, partial [bacterium]|nr:ORF6N domain-containing protein [bacterium]
MNSLVPIERIENKILLIRGQKVMLDRELAELYEVPTRRLNEQVKRNIRRFPEDFMFQLTKEEFENWKSQIAISNSERMGLRHKPYAFTEHGILMLSSVLNSERAILVNIQIMRTFTKLRE